jgi:hypothetical protein
MRKLFIACLATAALATAAHADDLDKLKYELGAVQQKKPFATVMLTVENNLDHRIEWAFFECTFMSEDVTPIDTQVAIIRNLAVGGTAYEEVHASGIKDPSNVYGATCRITSVK